MKLQDPPNEDDFDDADRPFWLANTIRTIGQRRGSVAQSQQGDGLKPVLPKSGNHKGERTQVACQPRIVWGRPVLSTVGGRPSAVRKVADHSGQGRRPKLIEAAHRGRKTVGSDLFVSFSARISRRWKDGFSKPKFLEVPVSDTGGRRTWTFNLEGMGLASCHCSIPLKDNRASANEKRPHGGVAPHGLVIFRFTCEDQSQAQRLIQLSHPIMSKRWKCSNEKTVGFENGYTGRHRK